MKRLLLLTLTLSLLLFTASCGSASGSGTASGGAVPAGDAPETAAPAAESAAALPADSAETPAAGAASMEASPSGSKTLVFYFSRTGDQYEVGVIEKGNTAIVAEMIAEELGADTYEMMPADDHYPTTSYDELIEIGLQEQKDNARPAIGGTLPDFSQYDTIFIGSPVWWGDWPMLYYTFFESTPLSGKTLIPFTTHGGSGLSGLDRTLAELYPDCIVSKGLATLGKDAQNNPEKVRESVHKWLAELGYAE